VRWIHYGGAGIDHLAPWDPAQVTVTNSAGIAAAAIAEYTLGAIYALNMRLPAFMRAQTERRWSAGEVTTGAGQTLCVIGLGHIGAAIAKLARAAGFRVIGVRRSGAAKDAVDAVYPPDRLAEALAQADHTAVIVPLTPETRGLIGAQEIAAMKPGGTLINVSRGGVVEEAPLIAALEKNRLSGLVLDVFATEPLPADSPLWALPNVIVTPHIAGSFSGWERAAAEVFCENLRRYLAGDPLANVAQPAKGY
jgi:phosphoglycerate dehydrogenase-like enzyme